MEIDLNDKVKDFDKIMKINIYLMRKYGDKLYKDNGFTKTENVSENYLAISKICDKIYEEMNKEIPKMWYEYLFFGE